MSDLVERFPDTAIVWTNLVESNEDAGAMVYTALPGANTVRLRRVGLADSGSAVFEMVGKPSEHLAAHDLEKLSRELFANIPAQGPMSDRVLGVPDNHAWQLRCQRLVPGQVARTSSTSSRSQCTDAVVTASRIR